MSIGAIQHGNHYQNAYHYTLDMPALDWHPKNSDLRDECILIEKNDGDNDVYRNAFSGATGNGFRNEFSCGFVDLSSLTVEANKNNKFIGSLSNNYDVDYLKVNTMSQWLSGRPISVTMNVPEGCDYDLTVYDKDGNQVGISTDNGDGTKTVKIPCEWSYSKDFVLKIQKADGTEVNPNENYTLTFAQGEMSERVKQAIDKIQSNRCEILTGSEEKLAKGLRAKTEREEKNATSMLQLHKEQYQALPKELQYTGEKSVEELLARRKSCEELTDAEKAYVKIYGNINDIQKIEANEADQRFYQDFSDALQEAGISSESAMHISVSSTGDVIVTGLSEEDNAKVKELVENKFMQQIKNSHLNNSQTVADMDDYEYRIAGYVEELDRFLDKASGGSTTVDDLSIGKKMNGTISFSKYISGLPGNVANLVNNADADSNYYDYKQMMYEVLSYKEQNGTIPRYNVQMDVSNCKFDFT